MEQTDEKKEAEEKKPETTGSDPKKGNNSKSTELINEANIAAERLEAANREREDILKREQEMLAQRALGGETTQTIKKPEKKEETPEEYAERFMRGEIKDILK